MKKIGLFFTVILFSFSILTGCGNNNTGPSTTHQPPKYPFPSNAKATGKGKIVLSTPGGTSENGNIPIEYLQKDSFMDQIGIDLSHFNNQKTTFIYVNGKFVQSKQGPDSSPIILTLKGNLLKPGTYTVTAVQFDNNNPETGKVVELTSAKYEVEKG